jgi:hypothetical protein
MRFKLFTAMIKETAPDVTPCTSLTNCMATRSKKWESLKSDALIYGNVIHHSMGTGKILPRKNIHFSRPEEGITPAYKLTFKPFKVL